MRISDKETCATCGFHGISQGREACFRFMIAIPDTQFYCREFCLNPLKCDACGTPIPDKFSVFFPEEEKCLCQNCAARYR